MDKEFQGLMRYETEKVWVKGKVKNCDKIVTLMDRYKPHVETNHVRNVKMQIRIWTELRKHVKKNQLYMAM